jgi:hypothetical protein
MLLLFNAGKASNAVGANGGDRSTRMNMKNDRHTGPNVQDDFRLRDSALSSRSFIVEAGVRHCGGLHTVNQSSVNTEGVRGREHMECLGHILLTLGGE